MPRLVSVRVHVGSVTPITPSSHRLSESRITNHFVVVNDFVPGTRIAKLHNENRTPLVYPNRTRIACAPDHGRLCHWQPVRSGAPRAGTINAPTINSPKRRLMKIRYCLVVLMAAIHPIVDAADLAAVYEAAKKNDPVLGAARASYQASAQGVPQARAALLPSLNVGGSTSWTERGFPAGIIDANPTSPTFNQSFPLPDQEFNTQVQEAQLRQPLLNLSSWHTLGSARANRDRAGYVLAATEQALIVRAIDAYLDVLQAQDRLDTTLAEEAAVKRQLEQVQQRFDVGLVAITDVLESTAVYDNSVVNRIQADGDHDNFFETLRTLTGDPVNSLDRLSQQLPIVDPQPIDEETWVTTALANNLNIQSAQSQLQAAQRTLRARRADHLPTIDVTATRTYFETDPTVGSAFALTETETDVFALQLTLPIFQGGLTYSRAKEARALAEQSRQVLLEQQLTVGRDTRNLFRSVATDVVRVAARLKAIKSSESALEATETGYEVGTRNIVDVLQAQQRLFASRFDYAVSRYTYVKDLMRLKQAAGTLSETDITELNAFFDPNNPVEKLSPTRSRQP